jgi:hypothetical protein
VAGVVAFQLFSSHRAALAGSRSLLAQAADAGGGDELVPLLKIAANYAAVSQV